MKKISVFCALLLLVLAQTAAAQMNTSLFIETVKYKSNGVIEIEFDDNTVRDASLNWTGREAIAIFDKDGNRIDSSFETVGPDWLHIRSQKITKEETYTFEIKNVSYGTRKDIVYSGFFIASPGWKIEYSEPPRFRKLNSQTGSLAAEVFIRDIEYDRGGHLEVAFAGRIGKKINIDWNGSEKVTVNDETGRSYDASIVEYDRNKLKIRIIDAIENMNYMLELSDIPFDSERLLFRVGFVARDDWRYKPPHPRTK